MKMKCAFNSPIVISMILSGSICEIYGADDFVCFDTNESRSLHTLVYSDRSEQPVKLPYVSWTSAQISAHIAYILLNEKMRYKAIFVPIKTLVSEIVVNMVAGCKDTSACSCTARDLANPVIHTTLETWTDGVYRAACLPSDVRPSLANVLNYAGDDSYFLWSEVVEAAWNSPSRLALDYYRSYDTSAFEPHVFFDSWQRLLELLPPDVIVRCSLRMADLYSQVTNDTSKCDDDRVWFSPSCRGNTTKCVPILLQYFVVKVMQLSYFLNLPLAVVVVGPGTGGDYAEYYRAVRAGRFLFGYWSPDDTLVDSKGRLPVLLNLPRENREEQSRSIYRTGAASQKLQNFVWRELPTIDPQVATLFSRMDLFAEDMAQMLAETGTLKARGADALAASRSVACAWLKDHPDRWRAWVPAECPPGSHSGPSMSACVPCSTGSFCPGGYYGPSLCPAGSFCPAGAADPVRCPGSSSTPEAGGGSAANCTACAADAVALPGAGCVALAVVLPSILVPALGLMLVLLAAAVRRSLARERRLWRIPDDELVYGDPAEVLGRGHQGVVVKALLRGTPVAVKHFHGGSGGGADGPPVSESFGASGANGSGALSRSSSSGGGSGGGRRVSEPRLREEMRRLAGIRHPCITAVLGVASAPPGGPRGSCLVMELMELGSLWDLLHNRMFALDAELALQTLQSVAQGLRFLHETQPPVLHTDLKSPNVLFDRNFAAKLSDLACPSRRAGQPRGTLHWMAPECLRGASNTAAADVYSFGVVMHECLTRHPPYEHDNKRDQLAAIDAGGGSPPLPRGISAEMAALMRECLHLDPARRPPAAEIDRRLSGWDANAVATACTGSARARKAALGRRISLRRRSQVLGRKCAESSAGSDSDDPPQAAAEAGAGRVMASMFPRHVAEALMRGERLPPEPKEMVTMYFSDVVGFTAMSARLPPEAVSGMLDRLYRKLDALADAHGVHTLETIGDAYLCATNVTAAQPDHAARLARFAVAAVAAAAATPIDPADPALGPVQLRVGLHSGPCMAGVVGLRNPKYTLFGDTINVASRMESSSLPGHVHCSARTAELIRAQDAGVRLVPRGRIEVKGKGGMETWWVDPPPLGQGCDEGGLQPPQPGADTPPCLPQNVCEKAWQPPLRQRLSQEGLASAELVLASP